MDDSLGLQAASCRYIFALVPQALQSAFTSSPTHIKRLIRCEFFILECSWPFPPRFPREASTREPHRPPTTRDSLPPLPTTKPPQPAMSGTPEVAHTVRQHTRGRITRQRWSQNRLVTAASTP